MLFVLSPAKALDMLEGHVAPQDDPEFKHSAYELAGQLAKLSKTQLQALLEVSGNLTDLNFQRYKNFKDQPCKAACLAFNGDAYIGWAASKMSVEDLSWAQKYVRILSGLYGVLRPLDSIQPYRLNMGSKLKTDQGKDLYEYWGDRITQSLVKAMEDEDESKEGDSLVLINAASAEYFKALKTSLLPANAKVVEVVFQEANGKIVSVLCKKARGMLVRYAILNRVTSVEALKSFTGNDGEYSFRETESSDLKFVFVRTPAGGKKAVGSAVKRGVAENLATLEEEKKPEVKKPKVEKKPEEVKKPKEQKKPKEEQKAEKKEEPHERPTRGTARLAVKDKILDDSMVDVFTSLSDRVQRRTRQSVTNSSKKSWMM